MKFIEEVDEKISFSKRLGLLYMKRFELYRRFRSREIGREEYMRALAPLDAAVDRLELSLLGDSPTSGTGT